MPRKPKTYLDRRPVPACELGVLHAFGPGFLHAPNRMLEFKGSGDRRIRVPLRGLTLVCLYGPVRVTAGAIRLVTDAGAALAYFSANGARSNGILQPSTDVWKGRRYRQFQAANDRQWLLGQARHLVAEKIHSMAETLDHLLRHGRLTAAAKRLLRELPELREKGLAVDNHASLRGIEGTAARRWFEVLDELLPPPWRLPGRHKRPPTDPVNALLSLGYTVLFHRGEAACQAWGLDSAVGVYHEYRPGRASLACDLIEPFRIPVVDRVVLSELACGRLKPEDFVQSPADLSVKLTEEAWRRWLEALEQRLHDRPLDKPSLQMQIVQRVRQFAESLPSWNGQWPGAEEQPIDGSNP